MEDEKYIGEPLDFVKKELEGKGFKVTVSLCSLPKIRTDKRLVVALRKHENEVELIVGDFLIEVTNGV